MLHTKFNSSNMRIVYGLSTIPAVYILIAQFSCQSNMLNQ